MAKVEVAKAEVEKAEAVRASVVGRGKAAATVVGVRTAGLVGRGEAAAVMDLEVWVTVVAVATAEETVGCKACHRCSNSSTGRCSRAVSQWWKHRRSTPLLHTLCCHFPEHAMHRFCTTTCFLKW